MISRKPIKITLPPDLSHQTALFSPPILRRILERKPSVSMKIMLLLILISLLLAAGFLLVYLWAARNGQFDDDYTPSVRMLFEDTPVPKNDEINPDDEMTTTT